MPKPKDTNKFLRFFKVLYLKFFRINDSPQKIAQGAALGAFTGILPGMGPVAALFLAFIFHANRASAVLVSLLTNTWISFLTFILSIKLGSVIIGLEWEEVYRQWLFFIRDWRSVDLLSLAAQKVLLALLTGYLIIAITLGLAVYLLTLTITRKIYARKNRANLPG